MYVVEGLIAIYAASGVSTSSHQKRVAAAFEIENRKPMCDNTSKNRFLFTNVFIFVYFALSTNYS